MTTRIFLLLLVISLFLSIGERVSAQECKPSEITANARNYNIFSPEQEMVLGDLTYEQLLGELRFVKDEKLLAFCQFAQPGQDARKSSGFLVTRADSRSDAKSPPCLLSKRIH